MSFYQITHFFDHILLLVTDTAPYIGKSLKVIPIRLIHMKLGEHRTSHAQPARCASGDGPPSWGKQAQLGSAFDQNEPPPNHGLFMLKARPHLYANANKACRTEANANECQKVACSAFTTQANEQAFYWLFVGCPNECTSASVWLWTYKIWQ